MFKNVSSYRWLLVAALWLVCFLNYADRQALSSLFPLLKAKLGVSEVQLGVIGSSFMWMYALFGPLAGWLGDRLSRKRLILAGLGVWIVLEFAAGATRNYPQLAVVRGLSGLGEAFYFPAAMALISTYHGPKTRSRAMSIHQSAVYIGSILGGSLAGIFAQHLGWRGSFDFFGALGILIALPVTFMLSRKAPGDALLASTPKNTAGFLSCAVSLTSNPPVLRLFVVFMGANFVAMAFITWLPYFLHTKFRMSLAMAGISGALYLQVASVFGVLFGGALADKLTVHRPAGRLLTQAMGLMGGVGFLFFTGSASTVAAIVLAMLGFGFFKGIYDSNIFASLYDLVSQDQRSSAAGLMNSIGWLGGGFAPIAVAFGSRRYGMSSCLSATSIIYLGLSLVLFYDVRTFSAKRHLIAPLNS